MKAYVLLVKVDFPRHASMSEDARVLCVHDNGEPAIYHTKGAAKWRLDELLEVHPSGEYEIQSVDLT